MSEEQDPFSGSSSSQNDPAEPMADRLNFDTVCSQCRHLRPWEGSIRDNDSLRLRRGSFTPQESDCPQCVDPKEICEKCKSTFSSSCPLVYGHSKFEVTPVLTLHKQAYLVSKNLMIVPRKETGSYLQNDDDNYVVNEDIESLLLKERDFSNFEELKRLKSLKVTFRQRPPSHPEQAIGVTCFHRKCWQDPFPQSKLDLILSKNGVFLTKEETFNRRGTPFATTWFYLPAFTLPDFESLFHLINDQFENDVVTTIIFEFINFAWILPKLDVGLKSETVKKRQKKVTKKLKKKIRGKKRKQATQSKRKSKKRKIQEKDSSFVVSDDEWLP